MGPCLAVEGPRTKAVFETYLERVLASSLRPGQVVVMDNLGAHKAERVRRALEAAKIAYRYLPSYSPDLSPVERCWSKLKAWLRKAKARTRESLGAALAEGFAAVTEQDAKNWFRYCGYALR